jgi:hypothetical protein
MYTELVAVIAETRNTYRILTGRRLHLQKIWRFTKILRDNIKIGFRERDD